MRETPDLDGHGIRVDLVHSSVRPASEADWQEMLRFCEQENRRTLTPRDVRVSAVRHMRQWVAGHAVNAAAGTYARDDLVIARARRDDVVVGLMWGGYRRGMYSSMRTVLHPEWTYKVHPDAQVSNRMWLCIFDDVVRRVAATTRQSVDFVLAEETCIQDHGRRWWKIYRRTAEARPDMAIALYPSAERGARDSEWTRGMRGALTRWRHGSPTLSVLDVRQRRSA